SSQPYNAEAKPDNQQEASDLEPREVPQAHPPAVGPPQRQERNDDQEQGKRDQRTPAPPTPALHAVFRTVQPAIRSRWRPSSATDGSLLSGEKLGSGSDRKS